MTPDTGTQQVQGLQHVKPCCPDCRSRALESLIFREVSDPTSVTAEATCGDCEYEYEIDYAAVNVAWEEEDGEYHDGHAEGVYGTDESNK